MNTIPRTALWAVIGLLLPLGMASAQDHQITPWRHNRAGAVSVTFDDGYWSQVTNAVPLLNARGLKATFFVTTSGMEVPWDQWWQVAEQGHEIASHSVTHPDFTRLTDSALRYELSESQRVIKQNIPSQSCLTLAYPGNDNNAHVQAITSEYYIAARGGWAADEGGDFNFYEDIEETDPWPWPPDVSFGTFKAVNFYNVAGDNSPYAMPISNLDDKFDAAVAFHAWYCCYLHAVEGSAGSLNYLATMLDHIVARDLWMTTFGEAAQYMRERKASTLSVLASDASTIQLDLTNSLDGSLYTEPLTIRSIVPFTWLKVSITQGGSSTIVDSAVEGADTVVYFDAVPNNGTIILTQSQGQGTEPDFMLVAQPPAMQAVAPGGSTSFAVAVSPINGFSSAVDLSVSGLPSGATASFTPNPATASSTLSVTTDPSTPAGTYTLTITGISGTLTHTATVLLTVTAPVLSSISLTPTSVVGGIPSTGTVTLDIPAPLGGAVVALSSSNTAAAQAPATVTVLEGATMATFTATTSPVAAKTAVTITALYNSVTRTTTLTVTASVLSSISLTPTSVVGGSPSTGTVTLSGPAPTGGSLVTLTSSNTAAAQVPASVMVLAGATTATFTATTSPVAAKTAVTIRALYKSVTRTKTLTVTAPVLSSISLTPTSVVGGSPSTGTVRLNGPAPTGGSLVTLTSSNTAAAQVPASVTVLAGATTATFTATTSPVAANKTPRISAAYRGTTRSATLTVTAPNASSLTLDPSTVQGGNPSTGTVTLNGPAPAAGMVVTLTSSLTAVAQVPASVTVAAGETTATFTVATSVVTSTRSVTISAKRGVTIKATLTVTP